MNRRESESAPPRRWAGTASPGKAAGTRNWQAKARAGQSPEQSRNVMRFQWLIASSYPSYCGFKMNAAGTRSEGSFEVRLWKRSRGLCADLKSRQRPRRSPARLVLY